ncbi:MAG: hypothetical protein HC833_21790 [Leptolyngbyaceae cyanobacterium RM1_406_9]|nr:hypothetical protein [Leptolyngbyaceae cyanobacterium RM1_406_9]
MSQSSDFGTFIGTDPETQTVVVVFPQPVKQLVLTTVQAQALATALMQRVLLLENSEGAE